MARISTYQHDAMPHVDDNVIGTNQSPGHANETVLFNLQSIGDLILAFEGNANTYVTNVSIFEGVTDFTSDQFFIDFPNVDDEDDSNIPRRVFRHNLNSRVVNVSFYETTTDPSGTFFRRSPGSVESVDIVDDNSVRIDFGTRREISGALIIVA